MSDLDKHRVKLIDSRVSRSLVHDEIVLRSVS